MSDTSLLKQEKIAINTAGVENTGENWRRLCNDLQSKAASIDQQAVYPRKFLVDIAANSGYKMTGKDGKLNLTNLLSLHKDINSICLNTGFCAWCHAVCCFYLYNSENTSLKDKFFSRAVNGEILAGTGLSNPMKFLAGIENIKLKAERVKDGYIVNGTLFWISNIERGHYFGAVMRLLDERLIVGFIDTSKEGIKIKNRENFIALNGSATVSAQFNNYFLSDSMLIAKDGLAFLKKIRPGFIILQMAMAIGNIRSSIRMIEQVFFSKKHLVALLNFDIEDLKDKLAKIEAKVSSYTMHPYAQSEQELKPILQLRLDASLVCLSASQLLMLAAGASGYQSGSAQFRKLREGYFVSIVTPSVTHLKIMLSKLK